MTRKSKSGRIRMVSVRFAFALTLLALTFLAPLAEAGTYWSAARRNQILHMCFGNDRFVAVGRYGNIHWSTNGRDWWGAKALSPGTYDYLHAVCYGNGQFIAVGRYGYIFRSTDGKEWTAEGTGIEESGNLKQIAYGDGRYLVVSEYGQHLVSQRTYTSGDEFGQPQLSVSGTGLVSIYAAMPEAEGGVFRLDHSTNLNHWNEVATDLSPAPDGMLYQGYFPLAPDPAFFHIFAQD